MAAAPEAVYLGPPFPYTSPGNGGHWLWRLLDPHEIRNTVEQRMLLGDEIPYGALLGMRQWHYLVRAIGIGHLLDEAIDGCDVIGLQVRVLPHVDDYFEWRY